MNHKLVNENIDDFYVLSESDNHSKPSDHHPFCCRDLCIQEHKNGLFVLSLSPKHFLCTDRTRTEQVVEVKRVEFPLRPTPPAVLNVNEDQGDAEDTIGSGGGKDVVGSSQSSTTQKKQKKTEIKVQPHTVIAKIYYQIRIRKEDKIDEEKYEEEVVQIQAHLKGKLVEVNERLLATPILCQTHPYNFGFLVIIDPNDVIKNLKQKQELMKDWKTRREYFDTIQPQQQPVSKEADQ
ncbi:hypothetical protein FDP41_001385 [Naegleria fowleri]|uniref:Protein Abitram n=1 Tax=Naegleria fowleri TaxID=5763 RepID=A0A6A5BRC3_NAEFO|nr:uncharacterized protein FDP41_001385 [Naegleria fowleri]KAF0979717.1 hypothetical protein FDP41_001385 [Naegleria fowleri]